MHKPVAPGSIVDLYKRSPLEKNGHVAASEKCDIGKVHYHRFNAQKCIKNMTTPKTHSFFYFFHLIQSRVMISLQLSREVPLHWHRTTVLSRQLYNFKIQWRFCQYRCMIIMDITVGSAYLK